MAVFEYKAVDLDATSVAGTIIADTPRQARDLLRDRGLTITRVCPPRRPRRIWPLRGRSKAAEAEAVAFIRELATLLAAGIPLLSALQTLARQHKRNFRAMIQTLADEIAAGLSLAEAMARQGSYFDTPCVSIVRVGENTGELDTALQKLAAFKEKTQSLRNRVTTALLYPAVVCAVGVCVSIFLMTYVVPNLLGTLSQAGKELPAITRTVKAASDFLLGWWWLLLAALVAVVLAVKLALRTEPGRLAADRLVLRIPIIGDLVRKENTSRMAIVMAGLLSSGLQFVEAVQITRQTLRNSVFRRAMEDYEDAVRAGSDIAAPLEAAGVFSPMVVKMLAVAQQAGQLEGMLQQLAEAYDREVSIATQRLTSLLEPLLIVLLAILVGFIAFATILPILEVSDVL